MEAKKRVLTFFLVLISCGIFLLLLEIYSFGIFGFATLGEVYTPDTVIEADFGDLEWDNAGHYLFFFATFIFCAYACVKFLHYHSRKVKNVGDLRHTIRLDLAS